MRLETSGQSSGKVTRPCHNIGLGDDRFLKLAFAGSLLQMCSVSLADVDHAVVKTTSLPAVAGILAPATSVEDEFVGFQINLRIHRRLLSL
jgi:hypothetical protein